MRFFKSILSLERKRLFRKKTVLVLLLSFLLALYLAHTGILGYKKTVAANRDFQSLAQLKFENMMNYHNYSLIGIDVLFIPAPLAVLFHSVGPTSEWRGRVDTVAGLDIFIDGKGSALFGEESLFPFSFSFILLVLGTLFSKFYGHESFRYKEYERFLSGFASPTRIFISVVIARVIYMTVILAALFGCVVLLYAVEGIPLAGAEITAFLALMAVSWLLLLFFFAGGVLVGRIPNEKKALIVLMAAWGVLVLFLPDAVKSIVKKKAENITGSIQVELEQLKIIVDFEKRAEKNFGKFDRKNIETGRKVIKNYWMEVFKKVEKVENLLKAELKRYITYFETLSIFNPVSFYRVICNGVGGKGFEDFLAFYGYLQELKRNFLRFYIDQCFKDTPPVMVNFIRGDENLFRARSGVPGIFKIGAVVTAGYIFIALLVSFFLFKKSLYRLDKEEVALRRDSDIEISDHVPNYCFVEDRGFKDLFYNFLSGRADIIRKSGYTGKLSIDEKDLLGHKKAKAQDFFYALRPEGLPGNIKVRDLVTFVCQLARVPVENKKKLLDAPPLKAVSNRYFNRLKRDEAFQVILALLPLKKGRYYLVDDIAAGLSASYAAQLKDRMVQLNHDGGVVVFLTSPGMVPEAPIDRGKWFDDGEDWSYQVEAHRRKRKPKKQG